MHIVRESATPACLVELVFIGNKDDSNLLTTKENIYAKAIEKGICKYLGVMFKENDLNTSNLNSKFENADLFKIIKS